MIVRNLGIVPYQETLQKMQDFTKNRTENTADELWMLQHPATYTQGIKDSSKHLLHNPNNIPVIKTDRGGQITYHGLGQLVVYCLLDIKRAKIGVHTLVERIENSIIKLLKIYNIVAHTKKNAPGVYVDGAKIAALGLKVKHGKTYHGLSLNIDMDLTPFENINPCGNPDLTVINMQDLSQKQLNIQDIINQLSLKNIF